VRRPGLLPAVLKRNVYTHQTVSVTLHLSAVIYNLLARTYVHKIHMYAGALPRPRGGGGWRPSAHEVMDRARIPGARLPFEFACCAHSVVDKIPELHFVWNCNFAGFTYGIRATLPLLLPALSPPASPLLSHVGSRVRAHCIMNARAGREGSNREGGGWRRITWRFRPGKRILTGKYRCRSRRRAGERGDHRAACRDDDGYK